MHGTEQHGSNCMSCTKSQHNASWPYLVCALLCCKFILVSILHSSKITLMGLLQHLESSSMRHTVRSLLLQRCLHLRSMFIPQGVKLLLMLDAKLCSQSGLLLPQGAAQCVLVLLLQLLNGGCVGCVGGCELLPLRVFELFFQACCFQHRGLSSLLLVEKLQAMQGGRCPHTTCTLALSSPTS